MLGLRVQVQRQVAHVLVAVGQEHDLLVHLHALGLQHLEQPPLRLAVVGLDEAEALGRAGGGQALTGHHFEPPVALGPLLAGMDVAAIQAHGQGQVGPRQLIPLGLAALGEHRLLGAELVLQPLGGGLRVALDGGGVQRPAERQRLGQEPGAQPVGDQPGELALQVQQLGRGPLGQHRRQRAEGPRRVGWHGQCHQRGLRRWTVPNSVRMTIVFVSLWARTRCSRSLASANCNPRVSTANSPRSSCATSCTTPAARRQRHRPQ